MIELSILLSSLLPVHANGNTEMEKLRHSNAKCMVAVLPPEVALFL